MLQMEYVAAKELGDIIVDSPALLKHIIAQLVAALWFCHTRYANDLRVNG